VTLAHRIAQHWTSKKYVEDGHQDSPRAEEVRAALSHYEGQHDYEGPAWEGIEAMHYELAKVATKVGIEAAGWYKYPSSLRPDKDGKDWRLIVPDPDGPVVVNCHSLLHDGVWTLTTTVFSTHDVDFDANKIRAIYGHRDHWTRTLVWTLEVAKALAIEGYNYDAAIADIGARIEAIRTLRTMCAMLLPIVQDAKAQVTGSPDMPPGLSIGPSLTQMSAKAVGRHERATDDVPYSIITVSPKALNSSAYTFNVLRHELIHYALGIDSDTEEHGDDFHQIADIIGLPEKYRD